MLTAASAAAGATALGLGTGSSPTLTSLSARKALNGGAQVGLTVVNASSGAAGTEAAVSLALNDAGPGYEMGRSPTSRRTALMTFEPARRAI